MTTTAEPPAPAATDTDATPAAEARTPTPVRKLGLHPGIVRQLESLDLRDIVEIGDWFAGEFPVLPQPPADFDPTTIETLRALVREWHGEATAAEPAAPPPDDDDPTTPAALARYDDESRVIIFETQLDLRRLNAEVEDAKARASGLKKEYDLRTNAFMDMIAERQRNRGKRPQKTLFDGVTVTMSADDPDAARRGSGSPKSRFEQLWDEFPIAFGRWERFGLTAKDVEKLNTGEVKDGPTHPILTLGDLTRFITPNPANPSYARTLTDIKGFGDKGADRWSDAESKFWRWWAEGGHEEFAREMGVSPDEAQRGADGGGGSARDSDGAGETPALPGLEGVAEPADTDAPRTKRGKRKAG